MSDRPENMDEKPTKNVPPRQDKREKPPTKVVIRRLPPTMEKSTFLEQISPIPQYDYFYMVNGEAALGENSFSRAYINFINLLDVFDFKEKFDNYVFLDHKGEEYPAVVEFAAFQKIPKKRNKAKVDPKCGTIETDPYYLEFIENINKPVEIEDKPEFGYQFSTENKEELMVTPLLEYVKNRRVEKMKIREERREERRKKEAERKKIKEEERKKRFEEKSITKVTKEKDGSDDLDEKEKKKLPDKTQTKEKKYDDIRKEKIKGPPKKEYPERKEFRPKKDHPKETKYDTRKEETPYINKKVKKYSEKREERKLSQKKAEESKTKTADKIETDKELEKTETEPKKPTEEPEKKPHDKQSRKERIRNKDRPTIEIYRPGMLSKRKQVDGDEKDVK